jgi:hypothetical protein
VKASPNWFNSVGGYRVWVWVILVPLLNWPAISIPFERDEGEYLWAATLMVRGRVAYRDVFLQKPPGIIAAYYALLHLTDGSAQSIHIALLILYMATATGIGAIAWRLSGRAAVAAVSIILYALSLSTPLYQASAANTESFMVAAIVLCVFCLLKARETQSPSWVILFGVALGTAGMMKQTAAPHILWLLPSLVFFASNRRDKLRWPMIAGLASAIVVVIVCLPYVLSGAGRQLLDGVILHNLEYSGAKLEKAFYTRLGVSMIDVAMFHVALWLGALAGLILIIKRRQWWQATLLGGWTLSAWVGVSVGAFYRGHYFLQLLPSVAILASFAVVTVPRRIRNLSGPLLLAYWILSDGFQWNRTSLQLSEQRYHTNFFHAAVIVGDWLKHQPDRSLYILGSEPEIYYYADAIPVTRYVIKNPLFGGFASSQARQIETWKAIERGSPKWIVTIYPPPAIPFFPGSNPWLIDRVNLLLKTGYAPRVAALREGEALLPVNEVVDPTATDMTVWERIDPPIRP